MTEQVVVRAGRGKLWRITYATFAFVAMGVLLAVRGEVAVAALMAAALTTVWILGVRFVIPGRVLLVLDEKGITDSASIMQVGFVPWTDIASVSLESKGTSRWLLIHLATSNAIRGKRGRLVRWMSPLKRLRIDSDIYVPNTTDLSLEAVEVLVRSRLG